MDEENPFGTDPWLKYLDNKKTKEMYPKPKEGTSPLLNFKPQLVPNPFGEIPTVALKDGEREYYGGQFNEITITGKGKYPHYNNLTQEQKNFWNDKSPLGAGVRRQAMYGKGDSLYNDLERDGITASKIMAGTIGVGAAVGLTAGLAGPTVMGAIDASAAYMAPKIGAALSAPLTVGGTQFGMINTGNLINAGFATDFLVNRAPAIPGLIKDKDYGGVARETAFGALDLMGIGAGRIPMKIAEKTPELLKNIYNINPLAKKYQDDMLMYRMEAKNFDELPVPKRNPREGFNDDGTPYYFPAMETHGKWFFDNPSFLHPMATVQGKGNEFNIIRTQIPRIDRFKYNASQMLKQKGYDDFTGRPDNEFILPKHTKEAGTKFPIKGNGWDNEFKLAKEKLIAEDKAFNTPHWLKGYPKEVPNKTVTPIEISISNEVKKIKTAIKDTRDLLNRPKQRQKLNELNQKIDNATEEQNEFIYGITSKRYNVENSRSANRQQARELDDKLQALKDNKKGVENLPTKFTLEDGKVSVNSPNPVFAKLRQGEVRSFDFTTGEEKVFSISTGGGKTTYEITKAAHGKVLNSIFSGSDAPPNIPKEYVDHVRKNIKFLEDKFKGSVFGSSRAVAETGLPHGSSDYDMFITRENYDKLVKDKFPLENANERTNLYQHTYNNEFGKQGTLDFNVIESDEAGKATGTRAIEMYRQFFPDEFYKESKRIIASGDFDQTFKIDKTPDQLMKAYDPEVKTVMDAYEINPERMGKDKHGNRIDAFINVGKTETVKKAQEQFTRSLVGSKGTIGPQFNKSIFSDIDKNKEILKQINFLGDQSVVAKDPERMQLAMNDWYMNNSIYSRGTNADGSTEQAMKYWDKKFGGGNLNGEGLNTTKLGETGYGGLDGAYGHKQIYLDTDASDPLKHIDLVKKQTDGFVPFTIEEKSKMIKIHQKYNINPLFPGYYNINNPERLIKDYDMINSLDPLKANAFYDEVGKALNIKSTATGVRFGNSEYASTIQNFDEKLDLVEYTLGKYASRPNSTKAREDSFNSSLGSTRFDIHEIKTIKGVLEQGKNVISKIDERIAKYTKELEIAEAAEKNSVRKIQTHLESKHIDQIDLLEKKVSDAYKERALFGERVDRAENMLSNAKRGVAGTSTVAVTYATVSTVANQYEKNKQWENNYNNEIKALGGLKNHQNFEAEVRREIAVLKKDAIIKSSKQSRAWYKNNEEKIQQIRSEIKDKYLRKTIEIDINTINKTK